jgi:predicted CoA-binding protein
MFFIPGNKYVVLGASTSPFKFGNKILQWYIKNKLPVTPINPSCNQVLNLESYSTLNEYLKTLKDDKVSISVVTPPAVSYDLFKEVKDSGNDDKINAIWFQPGSYDDKVIKYVKNEIGIKEDSIISDGDCILISGKFKLKNI